ncbi:MAG: hypothetical protein LLF75_02945 [Eubacteriales bacterium]|nr:hypothetical protein [Eubacteriales bacterium]
MKPKLKSTLSKVFAIAGTLLLAAPILFMIVVAVIGSVASQTFLFDYLMLAEVYPVILLGLILLVLASLFARVFSKWIGWGSAAALILLAGSLLYANASGLATGALTSSSGAFIAVVIGIALYSLLVLGIAVLGMLLIKNLFQKKSKDGLTSEASA